MAIAGLPLSEGDRLKKYCSNLAGFNVFGLFIGLATSTFPNRSDFIKALIADAQAKHVTLSHHVRNIFEKSAKSP